MAVLTLAQKRRMVREACVKYFFEKLVNGSMENSYTYDVLLASIEPDVRSFFEDVIKNVDERFDFLKSTVSSYVKTYKTDRIYKVDLAILIIASYEIVFTQTPDKVAANEAIEIAKIYSTDSSPSFVNGVLASVIRDKEEIKNNYEG